jgi:hypothetical protein
MGISKGLITALSVIGVFAVMVIFLGVSFVSAYNYANEAENGILAQYKSDQNILSNYYNKVQELVQVADAYKDGLKEIVTASVQGRYGPNGSQATMQWLKEHEVKLDPSMYNKLSQVIEAGRNEFKNAQDVLIDKKRAYDTNRGYLWEGFWIRLAGYPTNKLDDIKIITSSDTQKAFETGVENPLAIHKSSK